jgi:C-terminal processing protease CtpA/Prc
MQKILKWFTPVIAMGVTIFIIFFLISINSSSKIPEIKPLELRNEIVQKKPEKVWLNHFSKTQKLGYFYPVNEVYVKVDLDEKIIKTITYELSASLLDPYQLFCLKEELKQHKLKYYLKKDGEKVDLLIYSKNKNRLESLLKALKNYQIVANIRKYKEEI